MSERDPVVTEQWALAVLRVCATCGYVGCCESQRAHDTEHWRRTGHPIIRSLPLGKRAFTWCYACNAYLD
jgi:uncharacterized UBP type Zn finger protein